MSQVFLVFDPVFNGAAWLDRTIESVLAQSRREWELFVGDSASDDAAEAVKWLGADPGIRFRCWSAYEPVFERCRRAARIACFNRLQVLR